MKRLRNRTEDPFLRIASVRGQVPNNGMENISQSFLPNAIYGGNDAA